MSVPYTVSVSNKGSKDLHIVIEPTVIVTDEKYLPVVSKTFQGIFTKKRTGFKPFIKASVKKEIMESLTKFHKLDMIKPKYD